MNQANLWQSILNAKKAVVAGLGFVAAFITATLTANGGKNLTWQEWLYAAGAYVVGHVLVYHVTNDNMVSTKNLPALVASTTAAPDVPTDLPSGPLDS